VRKFSKLKLNRETLRNLEEQQFRLAVGGVSRTGGPCNQEASTDYTDCPGCGNTNYAQCTFTCVLACV